MPNITKIEWTDRSCNPIRARHKVTGKVGWHCVKWSSGCAHCYAAAMNRWRGTGLDFTRHSADQVELFLDPRPLEAILKLRKPQRIFLCDMTDLFQEGVSYDDILRIFIVMEEARQHTFQILTKRADRMAAWVNQYRQGMAWSQWPLPNVWLGVSCEDQAAADARIPHLLDTPAAVRFLSVEPLLGPMDLTAIGDGDQRGLDALTGEFRYYREHDGEPTSEWGPAISWTIVGGESGPGARPMHVDWARSVVQQCDEAGVPCFMKQMGSRWAAEAQASEMIRWQEKRDSGAPEWAGPRPEIDRKGGDPAWWPENLRIRQFPEVCQPSAGSPP